MSRIILFFIHLYQKTLSPDHGIVRIFYPYGRCKWYPTCSVYAIQAIESGGVIRGIYAALRRILRCHPWTQGGLDFFSEKK